MSSMPRLWSYPVTLCEMRWTIYLDRMFKTSLLLVQTEKENILWVTEVVPSFPRFCNVENSPKSRPTSSQKKNFVQNAAIHRLVQNRYSQAVKQSVATKTTDPVRKYIVLDTIMSVITALTELDKHVHETSWINSNLIVGPVRAPCSSRKDYNVYFKYPIYLKNKLE